MTFPMSDQARISSAKAELGGADELGRVAQRLLGTGMGLDDDAVGAGRDARAGERGDQLAPPGRVAGVDDHGQVGLAPSAPGPRRYRA